MEKRRQTKGFKERTLKGKATIVKEFKEKTTTKEALESEFEKALFDNFKERLMSFKA
jgi:hypothetical protein